MSAFSVMLACLITQPEPNQGKVDAQKGSFHELDREGRVKLLGLQANGSTLSGHFWNHPLLPGVDAAASPAPE